MGVSGDAVGASADREADASSPAALYRLGGWPSGKWASGQVARWRMAKRQMASGKTTRIGAAFGRLDDAAMLRVNLSLTLFPNLAG